MFFFFLGVEEIFFYSKEKGIRDGIGKDDGKFLAQLVALTSENFQTLSDPT